MRKHLAPFSRALSGTKNGLLSTFQCLKNNLQFFYIAKVSNFQVPYLLTHDRCYFSYKALRNSSFGLYVFLPKQREKSEISTEYMQLPLI